MEFNGQILQWGRWHVSVNLCFMYVECVGVFYKLEDCILLWE